MDTPLDNTDIAALLPGVPIHTYTDLEGIDHIEQLLGPDGRAVLLFLTTGIRAGHWVGIWKRGRTLNFFDSFGLAPDAERKWLSASRLVELHEDVPLLKGLFEDAKRRGYSTTFNHDHFQNETNQSETCGRHVAVRLNHTDLDNASYRDLITEMSHRMGGASADEVVVQLTKPIVGK
jgi:hypothetical protein